MSRSAVRQIKAQALCYDFDAVDQFASSVMQEAAAAADSTLLYA
jgi:hypothetical protein